MKAVVIGLLALMLAACGEPDSAPSVVDPESETDRSTILPLHLPASPEADQRRSTWLQQEHAGWQTAEPEQPAALADPRAQLAIVIDDIGHQYVAGRRLLDLPVPVTLAILPYTRYATQLAAEAQAAGRPAMLHLPMENAAGLSIGPGGLYAHMDVEAFKATLEQTLDSLQPIVGVNNHMGSLLTSQRPQMDWLMQSLRERELFFVDSRTSAETQAAFAAEAAGVPHLSRHVFLDNQRDAQAIDLAFKRGLALARERGFALLIGHPHSETLAYLERVLPELERREGVRVVSVQSLLDQQ
ncbi:MAG: hypothetical protein CVV07_11070 [Gammaproteobacteria bacterium HGW-Gammaproteobacteria-11]|nr:MAG: hypothetical protein CVV07_11070 [Gammaproteobacteria bacterium HGW-Gammaproteobacteria-11]